MATDQSGLTTINHQQMDALQNQSLQRVQTQYSTAMAVQRPRTLAEVEHRLMQEADQAGEDFYYGWGAGKDRIEGASVGLAMSAVRCFGNCAVEMQPMQETRDAWIFTAAFIDLETGFTLSRQFRQAKKWVVYGKHDEARKEDIRFQIGQSKAARNVILNALPRWLINRAVDQAKGGVRLKVEQLIKKHTHTAVVDAAMKRLREHGITDEQVLEKYARKTLKALTVEDLVLIRGDAEALDQELDTPESLYPPLKRTITEGDKVPNSQASDALADRLERVPTTTADNGPPLDRQILDRISTAKTPDDIDEIAAEIAKAVNDDLLTANQAAGLTRELQDREAVLKG